MGEAEGLPEAAPPPQTVPPSLRSASRTPAGVEREFGVSRALPSHTLQDTHLQAHTPQHLQGSPLPCQVAYAPLKPTGLGW